MLYYKKEDIEQLQAHDEKYYMPNALFDTMQYKLVRLEVKWAYVACFNVLLKNPAYDKEGNAFIKDDNPQIIRILKDLANKKVDQEKIKGYLNELEEKELLKRNGRDIYLKKISGIF